MEDEQQTLKYGDNILLRCMMDNKIYYLLARNEQYLMETPLQINNSCTFNMYNYPQQMIFTIFPKLLYEAQNKFNSDKSFGSSFDVQKQLLQTRMETEKKYNQNLLKQTKGQKVIYGDTIMLYQPLSQVFLLRAENNNSNSNIGTILSQAMYFTIQPDPLALDTKHGSFVHSYDQFLLVQNDTILKFDTIQEISKLPEILKSNNLDHNNEFLTIPAMIENQYQFKFYRAQYKPFQNDSRETISHNSLQAIVLQKDLDPNHLYYGQYVRIVHMQKKVKKQRSESRRRSIKAEENQELQINKGYLTSSINAIGCYPAVYLQINENQNQDAIEKAASIFQIIPDTDQKYSNEISLQVGNKPNLVGYTSFLLRHMLTGEYLRVNPIDNKLQLSKEIINKYRKINTISSKKLEPSQKLNTNDQSKSQTQKNLPGIKLYRNLINQQPNQNVLMTQQDEKVITQYQQTQGNQDDHEQESYLNEHQLLFVTKLGNNPIFYKDQLPFTIETSFNIATKDGRSPIEVDYQEEGGYQVKLITKLGMFNQFGEDNLEQSMQRQLQDEWLTLIPELDTFTKKNKYQLSQQEKEVIEFIDFEKKKQAKSKIEMRHYKADDETFKPTFINLNPLNTKYLDIVASEDFSGSNFKFETVDQSEIEELNEVIGLMFPLVILAKNSIQLTTLKFKFSNLKFKDSKEQKDLASLFSKCQAQAIQNVNQAVKSLVKIMLWLTCTHEALAEENLISEPLQRRQSIAREVGCIDYVNKIIYELNINELLYENQDIIVQDEEMFSQDINQLIDVLSSFLQLVCKNSNENSLYVVQWYCLYKYILLRGSVNDLMRLDILITQLFQQSDVMVSFEFEVTQLSKETRFTNYNKHAFNLLIAFCLFTEFRKKEGIEAIIQQIFEDNHDTIFSKIIFDGNIQLILKEKTSDFSKSIRQSIDSGVPASSPFMLEGINFPSRTALNDYIISCVRLASEISKSSPALSLKQIKNLFPFVIVSQIIQDQNISSLTKSYFLELFQNSYMAKHFKPLPTVEFPQYLKMVVKQGQGGGFLGMFKKDEHEIVLYAFAQKKISDVFKKVQNKYLIDGESSVDFWMFMSEFITNFWKSKSIYEIKGTDHVYIKQLILTFTEFLKKGLFIDYLKNAHNFYNMYHKFIEFLKNSVVSATLEEKYIRHQLQGSKKSKEQKPQDVKDYLFESTVTHRTISRNTYAKSMIWLDELIQILIQLEEFQQSRMADQFITTGDNQLIFDDLLYLQKFAKQKKYVEVVQRLRQAKRASYHSRAQQSQPQLEHKDIFTTQELTTILRECSYAKKTIVLEYMGGIKQTDISLVYFLIELLTLNQIKLSAKVTELLWLMYSSRSNFLQTLNQTILIDALDQGELLQVNQNIFSDFSNIYWKLHFAIIDLEQSLEKDANKHYESINDALSDMLVIFFPDYAAKSDMQMYMEINQLENEEKHYQAQEEKMVKSKIRQESQPAEQFVSKAELDLIDDSAHSPMKERQDDNIQSIKSATTDQQQKFVWKINNSLSIDVVTIYYRQKLLRYLGFQDLMQKLIVNLIQETSTLFREKDALVSNANKKGWEIKSDILEKSILFLIYFVIRNEENQEMILNLSKQKDSFLHEMSNVKRKQLQTLIYILFAELFRDNFNILFSLDKFNDDNSILAKLFQIFGNNFSNKNYEASIYFLQFLQILLKVKESDVIQNNYVIVQLFLTTKQLSQFPKDIEQLINSIYLFRLESFFTGSYSSAPLTPHNQFHTRHIQLTGQIEMPIEIVFLIELIRLLRNICSKRSQLVNEFIKKILPINRVAEILKLCDDWYPLKSELLLYFNNVFLDNVQFLTFEEKQDLVKTVTEIVFKQMTVGFIENNNLKKYSNAKLTNSVVFNIFGTRNQYTNQEFIMSIPYEKAGMIYVSFGVIEVTKQFVKKVCPKFFHLDEVEHFDDSVQNDLIFMAYTICENITRVKEFSTEVPNGPHGNKMKNSNFKRKSGQKVTKLFNLTHKLLSSNQDEQNQELSFFVKEENEVDKENIIRIVELANFFQQSDIAFSLLRNDLQQLEQVIIDKWQNSVKSQRTKLVDEHLVASERESEIQQLVNLIITLKRDDTKKFKRMVTALIQMLSEGLISPAVKLKSINILRKLSNYKEDVKVSKSILKDLGELGFTDFLCDLIKQEADQEQKLEYIKAFVDYIDDSSREIQNSFLMYLQRDIQNTFIITLQNFITEMFQDVKMAEISKIERKNKNINKILNNKINGCILIFEMFRLGCEDHFSDMQNFLRIQPNSKQPINFIMFSAELFEKYVEIMNEHNAALGQKLLDFLIECVQGPCLENQSELCQSTKILEVLEQIILQQRVDQDKFQRKDIVFSSLRNKVFLLQLSLMEGNSDQEIARKISQYFNPQVLFERIQLVYWKIIKKIRNTQIQINLEVKVLDRVKTEVEDPTNLHGIIQTKDTKETLPNQNLFMEFFSEYNQMKQSTSNIRNLQQNQVNAIQEEEMEEMVGETFMMYLLLKKLSNYIPQIKNFTDSESNPKLRRALNYYKNETASIEIVNMNGKLEKIYFQVPTLMKYLTEETKHQFMEEVERDSINDKINGLLDNMDNFYMEMVHFMKLRKIGIRFNNNFIVYLRNICILLALLLNILITISDNEEKMANVSQAIAIIDCILYGVIMVTWIFIRMQLEYDRIFKEVSDFIKLNYLKKKTNQSQQQQQQLLDQKTIIYPFSITLLQTFLIIKRMIFSSYTFYWLLLLVINLLGIFYNKLFYGFLLLDIIDHSQVLRNVIKSISLNYKQLLMTALLGVLVMYLYSLVAYQSVDFKNQLRDPNADETTDQLDQQVCYSAFQCLVFVIHQGLRAGGGVGDVLQPPPTHSNLSYYSQRVLYDVSFFIIINIIWLNIIFGIIIDTFAELRDQKNQKDFDSQNRCYICDLTRTIFEKEGISFDVHVQKYHNPWNYLAYLLYLKVKQKTEHTGTESYVYSKFQQNDISWLPIQKAIDIEQVLEQSKQTIDFNQDDHNQKLNH